MTTTVLRTLADVQTDLSLVLQRKTCDMVWVGRLLNEAKSLVEHGEWLGWLRRYTALSARSAQNYMKAAAFADAAPTAGKGACSALFSKLSIVANIAVRN